MDMTTTLVDHTFRKDVRRCFERQTFAIPARWLYDRRGSELFEEITELLEYYPTRTETKLLEANGPAFAAAVGPKRAVIEFGSGRRSIRRPMSRSTSVASFSSIAHRSCKTNFRICRYSRSRQIS